MTTGGDLRRRGHEALPALQWQCPVPEEWPRMIRTYEPQQEILLVACSACVVRCKVRCVGDCCGMDLWYYFSV